MRSIAPAARASPPTRGTRISTRDRRRLALYYVQSMTLAEIGRLTKEHEATVSRHLTRTRKQIREDVERRLRAELTPEQVAACLASVTGDSGTLDVAGMLGYKEP